MPMPLDTRANRDEEHKQAIIQYEKSVIEPKLVETIVLMVNLKVMYVLEKKVLI